ncbi:NAD-dependent epimerase/dehydratase family protein [Reichenbachiella faecimaris]|uniref:NAD-dependent epimerase/dehydratase family protein n=1 Tax=Reichenbachiella faecimaris TaxID=692418 RepID=UPI000A064DC3|nr:NAD-dependent epimerase/dehydratase family protein [Reichenbachiella faecimaris]
MPNYRKEVLQQIQTITNQLPEFVEIDLGDEAEVNQLFTTQKIDAVVHFAASKSVVNPLLNYELVDRRPGYIEKIFTDISYAKFELGWTAQLGIEDMMRTAYQW